MSNDAGETTERAPVITITVDQTIDGKRVQRSWVRFAEEWDKQAHNAQGQFLSKIVHGLCAEVQADADELRRVDVEKRLSSGPDAHHTASAPVDQKCAMAHSAQETLRALDVALAGVEADDHVRASLKEMQRVLTRAIRENLEQYSFLADDT